MFYRSLLKASLAGIFLLIGTFGGGCTINYELNTTPISKWQDHQRLPVKVNLALSGPFRAYVFDKSNFEGDHYRYPIGKVMAIDARAMAEAAFVQVIVTDGKVPLPPGIDATLTPEVGLVDRSTSAWAFDPVDMTVDLKWTVTDARGRVVWVKTVRGVARHNLGNAFTHMTDAKEHVDLVMIDLFNKSLLDMTTAPEIRGLAAMSASR